MMKTQQSRYEETAELMDQALLLLLENKEYNFISVKEICLKAGVHRSTFYLHYESMDDLLKETVEWVQKQFYASFQNQNNVQEKIITGTLEDVCLVTPEYLKPYLSFIKENRKIFELIHKKPNLFQTEETFAQLCQNIFMPIMERFTVPKKEQPYVLAYYSHGVLAMVMEWIKRGYEESIDDIIALIMKYLPSYSAKKEEK